MKNLIPRRWRGADVPVRAEEPARGTFPSLFDEFFQRFEDGFFGPWPTALGSRDDRHPSADVYETGDEVQVEVELPGVNEDDLELTLSGDALIVKGEKRAENEERRGDSYVVERSYGSFHRAIPLPCAVDQEGAQATFKKGVLHVRLPKRPEARTQSIPVQRAD